MATGAPDYFKRIMLFGLYDGAAVPLACDEQGRLIFIAEEVSPLHKTGTILRRDTFDSGLVHVRQYTSGTGAAIALDEDEAHVGSYGCKLTGGSDGVRTAYIQYYVHPSGFNKMGTEATVRLETTLETFELEMIFYTGTRVLRGKVRYNVGGQDWEIYDYDTSAYVAVVEDEAYHFNANEFIPLKLIIDLENEVYYKFNVAFEEVDLAAYGLSAADSSEPQRGEVKLTAVSTTGNNGYAIVDDVIITQDES